MSGAWVSLLIAMPSDPRDIAHLLRRSGFAALPAEISALTPLDWEVAVESVLDPSRAVDPSVGVPTDLMNDSAGHYARYVEMVWFWLERARTTQSPIVEKMVLFWHGHFCSSLHKVGDHQAMFDQNQLFRTHGLGDFRELTRRAALQPAMLAYLDNDQNKVGSPNENFARELMELFTLGVDNYSEDDVRESARAWTGHGINKDVDSVYQYFPERHDGGSKTFFGQTGSWDGPDIINLILDRKRTVAARFIARKLWSFMAYPNPEQAVVDSISTNFAATLNITDLLRSIFLHPQFRSTQAKQGLIRSPVEYAVAAMRHTGASCSMANPQWSLRAMGQEPFRPPHVAGWKSNEYWISSSATWGRSSFASTLRWRLYEAHIVFDAEDKQLGKNPTPAALDAHLQMVLDRYGITNPSSSTWTAIRQYLDTEDSWARRSGLLLLPLLSPEFQLA